MVCSGLIYYGVMFSVVRGKQLQIRQQNILAWITTPNLQTNLEGYSKVQPARETWRSLEGTRIKGMMMKVKCTVSMLCHTIKQSTKHMEHVLLTLIKCFPCLGKKLSEGSIWQNFHWHNMNIRKRFSMKGLGQTTRHNGYEPAVTDLPWQFYKQMGASIFILSFGEMVFWHW